MIQDGHLARTHITTPATLAFETGSQLGYSPFLKVHPSAYRKQYCSLINMV
jgi:hypothetical protein